MSWVKHITIPVPLRLVLIVPFVLQTVGAVTLVGYLSYRSGQQTTENLASQLLQQHSERVSDRLHHYLHLSDEILVSNRLAVEQGTLNPNNKTQLQQQLWQQMLVHPSLSGTFFASEQGEFLGYGRILSEQFQQQAQKLTGKPLSIGTMFFGEVSSATPTQRRFFLVNPAGQPGSLLHTGSVNVQQLPWYRYAKTARKQAWTPVDVAQALPVVGMWSTVPVYQPSGAFQGVFAAYFPLSDISEFLREFNVSPTGQTFIIERSGNLVATSTLEMPYAVDSNRQLTRVHAINSQNSQTQTIAKQLASQFSDLKALQTTHQLNLTVNSQRQFVQITPYKDAAGLDWLIVTAIPEADFLVETKRNTQTTILLCIITLGLAIASGLAIANRLTNSISRLNRASRKLATGDLTQRLPDTSAVAEMQGLTQSFNQMADQLSQSFDKIRAALDESEAKFTVVFRTNPDPILILTLADCCILEVNDRLVEFCGFSREELIGKTTLAFGIWKNLEEGQYLKEKLQAEGKIHNLETEFRVQSGIIKTVLISAEVRTIEGQECVICAIKDITDRILSQKALLQEISHRKALFEASIDGIVIVDQTGNIIEANASFMQMLGYSQDEIITLNVIDFDVLRSRENVNINIDSSSSLINRFETRHRRKDGTVYDVEVSVNAIDWDEQTVYSCICRDISDRKHFEAAIRESETRFQTLVANMPGMIYRYLPGNDGIGVFTYASAGAFSLLELEPEQVLQDASMVWNLIHPDDLPSLQSSVASAVDHCAFWQWEGRLITPSGQLKWVQGRSRPQHTNDGIVWDGLLLDISDRKHAEELLRQSEARYLSILEEQTELITRFNPDGILVFVNDAFCRYYDLPKEEIIGKSYKPRIYPEDQPLIDRCLAALSPENPIGKVEHRVFVKGAVRWTQWTNQVIYDAQGNFLELQSVGRDIHERKQAEIALRKTLQELNYHVENSPLATIRWDNSFRVEYWSKQAEEIFGWTSEEVLGKTMHDWRFIMEDDLDHVNEVAEQLLNGMSNICHNRNYHKDGSILYCEWYNSVLFDESGNLISMLSLLQDVTDREQVKQALQESQTKLQRLVDNIGEKFVIFSHTGVAGLVSYVSDGFTSVFGIDKETVLGKPWLDSIDWLPIDLALAQAYVRQAINERVDFQQYEMRFAHPDGEQRTLYISQHPVRDKAGHLVAIEGILEDITERKQAEAYLKNLQAALLEAQRVAHIGNWEFDIRTQTITWSPELFRMFGLDPAQNPPNYADYLLMIHPGDRPLLEQSVNQAAEDGTPYVIDYRAILPDGSMRYHEGRAEVERDRRGQVIRLFGTALDITERKRIEQTLQTSEARFRAIFEQAAVGINQADASGRYIEANQYFCDLLGYSKEEMLSLTFYDLTHPEDIEQHTVETAQLLQGEIDVLNTEIRYRHKNGDWIWTNITLSVIRDAAGNLISDLAIVIDIRDRKQAEAALKTKTEELDQFFSVTLDLLCIANIEGYFLRLNPQWEKTLGYRIEELEGTRFLDYVHPDDIESTLGAIANLVDQQEIPSFINRYRCKDGSYRSLEWRSFPLGNLIFAAARDVTERKQLEQDLIKNRDFRELLFNESNDALFLVDSDTLLTTDCNQRAIELFEVETKDDLINIEGHILQKRQFTTEELASIQRDIDQYGFWNLEVEYITHHGREFWGDLSVKQIIFGEKRFNLVRVADISDRKQAEQALQKLNEELEQRVQRRTEQLSQSEERLRLALIASKLGLYDLNIQTGQAITSPEYATMLGFDPETFEETNKKWIERLHPDDIETVSRTYQDYISNTISDYQVEFRQRTNSGRWKWILSIGKIVAWDETGQPLRMLGIHADIDDRKQAEQALQESRNILDLVLNAIPQRVFWKDLQSRFLGCNAAFAGDYQLTVEDIVGKTDLELPWAKWAHLYRADDLKVITTRVPKLNYEEPTNNLAGDDIWIRSSKIPLTNSQGDVIGILGCYDEITNLKQAESALQQLNSELEQRIQERTFDLEQAVQAADAANQTKSAFLANMSHELRTPLNVILGFAQLLSSDPTLKAKQQDYIRIMHRSGNHLLHLINDILDLSKIEANRITIEEVSIDIIELLNDLHAMFWEQTDDKALTFTLEIDPDLPQYIIVDPNRLRQILINLLSNAIKFTQYGGVALRVKCQLDQIDEPIQLLSASDSAALSPGLPSICFEVEDTGVGIALEEQKTIFEAFTQARAGKISLEGTGLGLAISHKIVTLLGGELTVQSALGQGSCFRFSIPLHPAQTLEHPITTPEGSVVIGLAPGQPTYRILVVDDHPDNRSLLVNLMTQIGLEVQEATTGVEAIALWQQWQPHLIWMDMQMPEMDGFEAIRRIRAEEAASSNPGMSATIIIALTAGTSNYTRSWAIAAGCDEFMSKPIQNDLILTKMADHLGLQYLYAKPESRIQNTAKRQILEAPSPSPSNLEPKSLTVMPPEWITALYLAALNCDEAETSMLIHQLPDEQKSLKAALTSLLHDYQFEVIVRLTQQNIRLH